VRTLRIERHRQLEAAKLPVLNEVADAVLAEMNLAPELYVKARRWHERAQRRPNLLWREPESGKECRLVLSCDDEFPFNYVAKGATALATSVHAAMERRWERTPATTRAEIGWRFDLTVGLLR
jgi:hypothetical protein